MGLPPLPMLLPRRSSKLVYALSIKFDAVCNSTGGTQEVQLANNKIGDAGAKALAATLEDVHSVSKLDLSNNSFGKLKLRSSISVWFL